MTQEPVHKKRLDSRLESEGAEFLVLGNLLIEGIVAHKHYVNGRDYDLVAVDPMTHRTALIQVKSRWATDAGDFLLRPTDGYDFVVFVRLNRGNRYRKRSAGEGKTEPTFHVIPAAIAKQAVQDGSWNKVKWDRIENVDNYRNAWALIRVFLATPVNRTK